MSDSPRADAGPQRRRLVLKPRDDAAAKRIDAERQAHQAKANPFGAAKPREAVIAEKLGKTEEEVLKEEVAKEKLHLRLSGAQLEEKRQAETEIKEAEEILAIEEDPVKKAELVAEVAARQKKLDELMETFAKVTLEAALSGTAPRVSQIRQEQALQQEGGAGGYGAPPGAYGGAPGGAPGGGRYAQPGGYPAAGGGGSFGGREFNEARGGAAGGGGGGRGFRDYQDRGAERGGGFASSYQADRQGSGSYGGRRGGGDGGRLPEWARDEPTDATFYDAPAATSAFIASGGYQGGGGGGGGRGREGRGGGGRGGGGRGGGRSYGDGGYGAGVPPTGRGLGGEFEFQEDSSFGAGQDRF